MPIDDGDVTVFRAEPDEGTAVRGGLVVIHEIWGLNDHTKDVAERFAAQGYVALAPDLLSGIGITPEVGAELHEAMFSSDEDVRNAAQPLLREKFAARNSPEFAAGAIASLRTVVDTLADDERVRGRIGVLGFCFGGSYAFASAYSDDRVRAAVPFYGAPPELERVGDIGCPVLAFYGEDDERLMSGLPDVRAAMSAAGVDFTDHVYPGTGHAFFNDTNAKMYDAAAAEDAWRRTLEFLGRRLA